MWMLFVMWMLFAATGKKKIATGTYLFADMRNLSDRQIEVVVG